MFFLLFCPVLAIGFRVQTSMQTSSHFSLKEATMFSRFAQLAYCEDTSAVRNWTCKSCVDPETPPIVPGSVRFVDGGVNSANQVLVVHMANKPVCVVSVRGSDDTMNWLRDFSAEHLAARNYCDNCKVHAGFDKVWQTLQGGVLSALAEIGCESGSNNTLYITGHSLGAAVMQLAMMTLYDRGFTIDKAFSFEAPRVGNGRFSDVFTTRFGDQYFRVTHSRDPVVHQPGEALGYYHAGTEVYFDRNGNYHRVCPGRENPACADKWGPLAHDFNAHCHNNAFGPHWTFCDPVCYP